MRIFSSRQFAKDFVAELEKARDAKLANLNSQVEKMLLIFDQKFIKKWNFDKVQKYFNNKESKLVWTAAEIKCSFAFVQDYAQNIIDQVSSEQSQEGS